MSAGRDILFITARQQSLGETYTATRFAAKLRSQGWSPHFLAFPFGAGFLRNEGFPVSLLGDDRKRNKDSFFDAVRVLSPELIFISDYYLFTSKDVTPAWSNEWLFDAGSPVATFDHLKFHPNRRSIFLAFLRRFGIEPRRESGNSETDLAETGPVRPGKSVFFHIDPLPAGIAGLVRPCPPHDPAVEADRLIAKFNPFDDGEARRSSVARIREQLGFSKGEKIVCVPVGSWAARAAKDLGIPYYDRFPTLLAHHFRGLRSKIRILLLSGEFKKSSQQYGNVEVHLCSGLPFDAAQDLLCASDLVLCDNVTSSSLSRAVMQRIPAAALINSVDVNREDDTPTFSSPFPLSPFIQELLRSIETTAPHSVFPFHSFPLGWAEELRPLFDRNPYRDTFEWLEVFDDAVSSAALEALLLDREVRRSLQLRQAAYATCVNKLPEPWSITQRIIQRSKASEVKQ